MYIKIIVVQNSSVRHSGDIYLIYTRKQNHYLTYWNHLFVEFIISCRTIIHSKYRLLVWLCLNWNEHISKNGHLMAQVASNVCEMCLGGDGKHYSHQCNQ